MRIYSWRLATVTTWKYASTGSFCSAAHSARTFSYFFFFQAEDGIRDLIVTGVQTCALPISRSSDATAATRHAAIAKSNAMSRPCWNGAEISDGKKACPVRKAACPAGSLARADRKSVV